MACEHLLKEFAKVDGLRVDLVTSSANEAGKVCFSDNITIHYLDIGKKSMNLHYQSERDLMVYSFKAYFYCRRLLRKKRHDFIHAFFSVPCGFIAMLLGAPYILSLRGSDVPFHNPRFYFLDKLLFQHLSKFIWRKTKFVIANSETLLESARRIYPGMEIGLIYNGVDTVTYKPDFEQKGAKQVNLLYAGRLSRIKGVEYLIEAFSTVLNRLPDKDVRLSIVGDGDMRGRAEELAARLSVREKIEFLGKIPPEEVRKLYAKCDIFVLPSLNEGMPMVLLEAMACGLAIICTDMPSLRLLVEHGRNGFIVEKSNSQAIAGAICSYIAAAPGLIREHGRISRQKALAMRWQDTAQKYREYYQRVLR